MATDMIYIATDDWCSADRNPFLKDGEYDKEWSSFLEMEM